MTDRIAVGPATPDLYRRLIELHTATDQEAVAAGLDQRLLELVRTRASQLNGCAFCVDMHTTALAKLGEPVRRVHALAVWRESGFFDEKESAALELAESITELSVDHVPDEVYDEALHHFGAEQLPHLVWVITVINAFNRLSVTSRNAPPPVS
ncbi:carboxymuconolactone decarboxylase family protein [Actinokineospora auranticolor]|uniref:AhpD family alkylhydroperoxidase n=1 Tax=Actinokineospora auranticolor TaxID=155976 RepID=A0A2S6GG04_9PSEU|nr:carboxymuconolactone decarboxylase family protein [Actinokineospora auranticolor]PPK64076.1 AhpD family alkylhydroperoxidase [Actinokineospora auranticolor]